MHPRMHTNAYMHTEQAGGLQNWLYRWTLYTHTGASVRQLRDGKSRIVVQLVVAKINLSKREKAVKDAVCDVCAQFDREQVPALPVRNEMPWGSDSMASAFASNMRSSVMRRGHASDRGGPCMHSGSRVCIRMHPGMHTSSLPVSAWFQRSGDGPGACMHCMHHSLIEDSRKRKETPYIDAYNAYKRKEFFSFLYI